MSLFLVNMALEVRCVNKVRTQQTELTQDCGTCAFRLKLAMVVYLCRPWGISPHVLGSFIQWFARVCGHWFPRNTYSVRLQVKQKLNGHVHERAKGSVGCKDSACRVLLDFTRCVWNAPSDHKHSFNITSENVLHSMKWLAAPDASWANLY